MYSKQIVENVEVAYQELETYMGRCRGAYFRRCVNHRTVEKTRLEPKMREEVETIRKCCDGYVAHDQRCLPFCSNNCNNGLCTAPSTCTCNDGYIFEANSTHKWVNHTIHHRSDQIHKNQNFELWKVAFPNATDAPTGPVLRHKFANAT